MLLEKMKEGEGGGDRHAIDDDDDEAFVADFKASPAAARPAEAAVVCHSGLREAETLTEVAGEERRDHSAGIASLKREERENETKLSNE